MNTNIVKFDDSRLSFKTTGDLNFDGTRLNRHERYEKHLLIDNVIAFKKEWTEDSDYPGNSEQEPGNYEVWKSWIKSHGLNPDDYK